MRLIVMLGYPNCIKREYIHMQVLLDVYLVLQWSLKFCEDSKTLG